MLYANHRKRSHGVSKTHFWLSPIYPSIRPDLAALLGLLLPLAIPFSERYPQSTKEQKCYAHRYGRRVERPCTLNKTWIFVVSERHDGRSARAPDIAPSRTPILDCELEDTVPVGRVERRRICRLRLVRQGGIGLEGSSDVRIEHCEV